MPMSEFILGLIMMFWNMIIKYHKPVAYDIIDTKNWFVAKKSRDGESDIFEVKQLMISRTPRKPFQAKKAYLYEVTCYTFVDSELSHKRVDRFPELCSSLFRNTKIPHILAINAFLNTKQK